MKHIFLQKENGNDARYMVDSITFMELQKLCDIKPSLKSNFLNVSCVVKLKKVYKHLNDENKKGRATIFKIVELDELIQD